MTDVRRLLSDAERTLAGVGIANARAEVGWLLADVLEATPGASILRMTVDADQQRRFAVALERRRSREPLQHILGRAAFRYLDLRVGPGVFVPRPETERLVDVTLAGIASLRDPAVVDLCSGSGAIGLAIATERPDAKVALVERSAAALEWLHRNVADQPTVVQDRVQVFQADVTSVGDRTALVSELAPADAVVANPPYVPTATRVGPEVAHDPDEAVYGGADGLDLYPSLAELATALLRPSGLLALEHDETHGPALADYLSGKGWRDVADVQDLAGRSRFVTARRAST